MLLVQVKRPRKPKQESIPPTIKEGFGYTYGKGDQGQSKLMWTIDGGRFYRLFITSCFFKL